MMPAEVKMLNDIMSRLQLSFEDGLLSSVSLLPTVLSLKLTQPQLQNNRTDQICKAWLADYAAGDIKPFDSDLFAVCRISDFRAQVWRQVDQIPFGEVRTYSDIARSIGQPRAARAVGTAIGKNPCLLFRPCHRVIASNGSLGGFALDINIKRLLLAHEGTRLTG